MFSSKELLACYCSRVNLSLFGSGGFRFGEGLRKGLQTLVLAQFDARCRLLLLQIGLLLNEQGLRCLGLHQLLVLLALSKFLTFKTQTKCVTSRRVLGGDVSCYGHLASCPRIVVTLG